MAKRRAEWDGGKVRALRRHLGLTQDAMAQELGTRQQTISEWETGLYQPRGLSERLLGLVAERAAFAYEATSEEIAEAAVEPSDREPGAREFAMKPARNRRGSWGGVVTAGMDIGMAYEVSSLWLRVGEPRPQKDPISEADLSLIWQGQRFPPEALLTTDGRAVAVVNPGRRGGGSGPDFIDAVVLLDGVERRGDVELHVRASYFHGHGHDRDPAYTDLALHVVYLADEAETRLQDGSLAPVAAFAPWLRGRVEELHSWQRAPEMWREPCKGATQRLGEAAVRSALEAAGRQRFEARVERMAAAVGQLGGEEALWRGLLDTLGVGGDRAGFVRLAAAFPAELATAVEDLEAALLYVAGLGPEPDGAEALPRPLSPGLGSPGRPANRPQIRLAGLAALVRRALERTVRGRVEALSEMALASVTEAGSTGRRLAAWTVRPQIGTARAQELLVNAVLPFVATRGLKPEALALLRSLPAGTSYGKTAFLESNLRPDKGRIGRNALQSQGLLGYVRQWCSQDGCGKCPLSLEPGDTPGPPLKGA